MEIIPSILTNNPQELKDLINKLEGKVARVSIDIIDGKFADNKTIDPQALAYIETNLLLDFQLMVDEPVNWIEKCASVGADRIIGHVEHMRSQEEFIQKAQELGVKIGLGLDLDSPLSLLEPHLVTNLDLVLLMSVKAGFGGQEFDKNIIPKIKDLAEIKAKDKTPFNIHLDGGISLSNIKKLSQLGVDEVSIGHRLIDGNFEENLAEFQKQIT